MKQMIVVLSTLVVVLGIIAAPAPCRTNSLLLRPQEERHQRRALTAAGRLRQRQKTRDG